MRTKLEGTRVAMANIIINFTNKIGREKKITNVIINK